MLPHVSGGPPALCTNAIFEVVHAVQVVAVQVVAVDDGGVDGVAQSLAVGHRNDWVGESDDSS